MFHIKRQCALPSLPSATVIVKVLLQAEPGTLVGMVLRT